MTGSWAVIVEGLDYPQAKSLARRLRDDSYQAEHIHVATGGEPIDLRGVPAGETAEVPS